jgi:hypothetical protein
MPRWDCTFIEDYGSMTSSRYLTISKSIGLVLYRPSAAAKDLFKTLLSY